MKEFHKVMKRYAHIPQNVRIDHNYETKRYKIKIFIPRLDVMKIKEEVKYIYNKLPKSEYVKYLYSS